MKNKKMYLICCIALLTIIAATGCVAPPKDTSVGETYTYNPAEVTPSTTTFASYVTEVTPYINSQEAKVCQTETLGYHTFATPTPLPSDKGLQNIHYDCGHSTIMHLPLLLTLKIHQCILIIPLSQQILPARNSVTYRLSKDEQVID